MLGNILGVVIRVLQGDCIWFALGGLSALVGFGAGWLYTAALKMPAWVKLTVALLVCFLGVLLMHEGFEHFMAWYTTPLAPHLNIQTN